MKAENYSCGVVTCKRHETHAGINSSVEPRQKNRKNKKTLQQSSQKISSRCSQPLNNEGN